MATIALEQFIKKWSLSPEAHVELLQLWARLTQGQSIQTQAQSQTSQPQTQTTKKSATSAHNVCVSAVSGFWGPHTPTAQQTAALNFMITIGAPKASTASGKALAQNMDGWGLHVGETKSLREILTILKANGIERMVAAGMASSLFTSKEPEKQLLNVWHEA
jgi:hypothetical protein